MKGWNMLIHVFSIRFTLWFYSHPSLSKWNYQLDALPYIEQHLNYFEHEMMLILLTSIFAHNSVTPIIKSSLHQITSKFYKCTYWQLTRSKAWIYIFYNVRGHKLMTSNRRICTRSLLDSCFNNVSICLRVNMFQLFHLLIKVRHTMHPWCIIMYGCHLLIPELF